MKESDALQTELLLIATCPINILHVLRLSEWSWKQTASDPSNHWGGQFKVAKEMKLFETRGNMEMLAYV